MRKKNALLEYGVYLFILIFVLFLAPKYLVEKILVDGTSMENSLHDQEHVLIEKISRYFDGPERFEIVVFTKNHGTYTKTYIKRVIGLPGETVLIVGDRIFINGEELAEDFGKDPMDYAGIAAEPVLLGEDEYFVLGDNRLVSVDSRDYKVGVVEKEELDGVVILRVAPWSAFGRVE
ncbi:MAG: signal peptidase I [Lachnospiraceae bacterium]|nr:signal peptidase I [Lachnospiraceae bacterium]MBP3611176.1 signal peptidase I [Lachnospiraceae bacterium]